MAIAMTSYFGRAVARSVKNQSAAHAPMHPYLHKQPLTPTACIRHAPPLDEERIRSCSGQHRALIDGIGANTSVAWAPLLLDVNRHSVAIA